MRGQTRPREGRHAQERHRWQSNWPGNQNPILDSLQYELEFNNGEVTDLTANAIGERMYLQCDKDRNDIFLIDYFVDYRNKEQSLSLQYHKLAVNGKPCMKLFTSGWEIFIIW